MPYRQRSCCVLSVLFAVLAAAANAVSSVLQRKGAISAPPDRTGGLRVVVEQLHHKVWFGGFGLLVVGFFAQAAALSVGSLAAVQPILAAELPFTLIIAARLLRGRLGKREWLAVLAMTGGLAAALAAAAPTAGRPDTSGLAWAVGCGCVLAVLAATAATGWRLDGPARAALLGASAGGLFGLTAAFMATVTSRAQGGVVELVGSWQLYAMIAGGFAALVVLQQAYGAGLLAAAQPGVTIVDPIVAVVLGVTLFGEQLRLGWLVVIELAGIAAIVFGALELSRSPLLSGPSAPSDDGGDTSSRPHRAKSATSSATASGTS
jgi:drug/metabolite transporter (DMT)-like permease